MKISFSIYDIETFVPTPHDGDITLDLPEETVKSWLKTIEDFNDIQEDIAQKAKEQ